jgi:predicted O-methyltransferase YrrM
MVLAAGSDSVGHFGGRFEGGVHLQQDPEEYSEFLYFVYAQDLAGTPHIGQVIELGTAAGGNAKLLWELFHPEKLILIDDNSHRSGAQQRIESLSGVPRIEIIADSQKTETKLMVAGALRTTADLLFIDGHHEYEWCRSDFLNYSPLVGRGGLMAFHDSLGKPGVARVMQEMEADPYWVKVGQFHRHFGITVWRRV